MKQGVGCAVAAGLAVPLMLLAAVVGLSLGGGLRRQPPGCCGSSPWGDR